MDLENIEKQGNQIPHGQPTMEEQVGKRENPGMSQTRLSLPPVFENQVNDRNALGTVLVYKL